MAAIRTSSGPVDLREKRGPCSLKIQGSSEVEIKKDWLKGKTDAEYRKGVMQAMLFAATRVTEFDALDPSTQISPEDVVHIKEKQEQLRVGSMSIPTPNKTLKKSLSSVGRLDQRTRSKLIKFSKKCCCASANKRERYFVIENGEILIYRSAEQTAKMKHAYSMREAEIFIERPSSNPYPVWEKGYDMRLRVDTKERIAMHKTPIYLYAEEPKLQRWKRAFNLAKLLTAEHDRRALKVSVGRATSASLIKGWDCLVGYYKEIKSTRAMVRTVSMRLMKQELNRAYSKMRVLYRSHVEKEKLRHEQRLWAARFISEKMARFSNQKAKSAADMRDQIVSSIQRKFRRYRNDRIFDRTYPLSSATNSKMTQAKLGTSMDMCMRSFLGQEVLALTLGPEMLALTKEMPDMFKTKKATYSEVNIPVRPMHVYVSENLSCISFSTETASGGDENLALQKASWSNFVNMDHIGSVIMHCEPAPGASIQPEDGKASDGVWFSINGPRVCWGRTMQDGVAVGAANGLEVPEKLARATQMKWAQVNVTVGDAFLKRPAPSPDESRSYSLDSDSTKMMLVVHVMGYAFKSNKKEVSGDKTDFAFNLEATMPVAGTDEETSIAVLANSEVAIEVFEILDESLGTKELVLVGSEKMTTVFGVSAKGFEKKFSDGCKYTLQLKPPYQPLDKKSDAHVAVSFTCKVQTDHSMKFLGDRVPISPEFMGMGQMTSVYTSHRGAWYDTKVGAGKFRTDHVPNFIEIVISTLRFPKEDDSANEGKKYRIKAQIGPVCVSTQYLTRPKNGWAKILGVNGDTKVIKFDGTRLYLPLPAGCFQDESRSKMTIQVLMAEPDDKLKPMAFQDYINTSGKSKTQPKEQPVYVSTVSFGNVLVDVTRNVSVYFGKKKGDTSVDMYTNITSSSGDADKTTECCLTTEMTLRDWDYAKAASGQRFEKRSLCIGDKAYLLVDEPILYPVDALEYRKRFIEGDFDPDTAKKAASNGNLWPGGRFPLRNPCVSTEFVHSGLSEAIPKVPFRQGFIPSFCEDISPHKFMLPTTEKMFLEENHPGSFSAIVDDLAANPPKQTPGSMTRSMKPVVTHLTKVTKKVSVTLLATYADGTCDVEVDPEFLVKWKKAPHKQYALPGQLLVQKVENKEVGRCLLKRVPMMYTFAVHSAGFHIYDALFHTSAEAVADRAPDPGFDPRKVKAGDILESSKGDFCISAGPLPPDASPSICEYEWSIKMRAADEHEMYKMVAMFRRCNRLDNFQSAKKMLEYRLRAEAEAPNLMQQQTPSRPRFGGQLDVLLMEARRLVPTRDLVGKRFKPAAELLDRPELKLNEAFLPQLQGTTSGEASKSTPEGNNMIGTAVNFRLLYKKDALAYRGQKVQTSTTISGTDSPSWAAEHPLKGGHLFHTGIIDPEKYPELVIDFEVVQYGPIPGTVKRIGCIQLPCTHKQFLTNKDDPLKNLWLPLLSHQDGNLVANPTGEIHIMCCWTPVDRIPANPTMQISSVRASFLKDIWPRVVSQRLREPIYGLEVQYLKYDPNLVRTDSLPETPKNHQQRHAEELCSAVPYLAALERRQTKAWEDFETMLAGQDYKFSVLRQQWTDGDQDDKLSELIGLIYAGIPSLRRSKFWPDITRAAQAMEQAEGASKTTPDRVRKASDEAYKKLVDKGLHMSTDAISQLREDAFGISLWESSTPPMPEYMEQHLKRIRRAQNVCMALIATGDVCYCEGLLVVAFFALLPQGCKDEKGIEDTKGETSLTYLSEAQVYWLLHTLICSPLNSAYKEYFGAQSLGSGVMADVSLLDACFAYHEPKVWQRLNAIGFQLASVFAGAFSRFYATYMPTSTVFRFWDVLFSTSSDPNAQPHSRIPLVNLAFGVLRAKRGDLIKCQSALEAKQLILGAMGSIYDMSTVVDLVSQADIYLWGGSGFSSSKIAGLWSARESAFRLANFKADTQNEMLRFLTQQQQLKFIPSTKYESPKDQAGVTTKELIREVIPVLNNAFENLCVQKVAGQGEIKHWFLHRPMPLASKLFCESIAEQTRNYVIKSFTTKQKRQEPSILVGPLPKKDQSLPMGVEPMGLSENDFIRAIQQEVPSWAGRAPELWKLFQNKNFDGQIQSAGYGGEAMHELDDAADQGTSGILGNMVHAILGDLEPEVKEDDNSAPARVSVNEMFMSLILHSRGTLGDKAAALFNIYADPAPGLSNTLYHRQPVSKLAQAIVRASDLSGLVDKGGAPPGPETAEAKNNALRLMIMSNYPKQGTHVGFFYIPMLGPYVNHGGHEPESLHFNVWKEMEVDDRHANLAGSSSNAKPKKKVVCIGDAEMAVSWTPKSVRDPEVGQLMLRIKGIKFYKMFVSDYFKINPYILVNSFMDGKPIDVPRWDPRGLIGHDGSKSWLTTHGAYGGKIIFEQTMKDSYFAGRGDSFGKYMRDGEQGWDQKTETWTWNDVWGKQWSEENFRVQKEFVTLNAKKTVMDLQGARLVVSTLLRRTMQNFTNRQALVIADDVFNRQGAVPGILEAVMVQGQEDINKYASLGELKAAGKKSFQDVTNEVALEHERQIKENGGYLNLFAKSYMEKRKVNLKADMGISYSSGSTLWIRYVRGGDGERCTAKVKIENDGNVARDSEVPMELNDATPHSKITKEEFVSCMLNSPLLGEAVRRLASREQKESQQKAVALDVTIMDPNRQEQDAQLMDTINVGQSLLFEVWDSDVARRDFLGEAWLPPLSTFGPRPRDIILPLQDADFSENAENGPSRGPESAKKVVGATEETKKIKGDLHCTIAWTFPAFQVVEDEEKKAGETMHDRAVVQDKLHTGKLSIKINKAVGLRRADAKIGRMADPQVTVWVRNDYRQQHGESGWREKYLLRTKYVSNTLNPTFNYSKDDITLQTGEYESRFPPLEDGFFADMKVAMRSSRAKQRMQDQRDVKSLGKYGETGLNIKFFSDGFPRDDKKTEPEESWWGTRHKQEVYLGDTIREFKEKLTRACGEVAEVFEKDNQPHIAAKYKDVNISYNHLVMVFVPNSKVQRLFAQGVSDGEEYNRVYGEAVNDPNSWQPLNPGRSFGQYLQFGFHRKQDWAHSIRVVEGTESYKLSNLRYKEFDEELKARGYEDRDTKEEAFGWAKYVHKGDDNGASQPTTEWRPCFASMPPQAKTTASSNAPTPTQSTYLVNWCFPPSKESPDSYGEKKGANSAALQSLNDKEAREKALVLLKPRTPAFDDYVHPMHEDVLDQARILRKAGKSDFDIKGILQKQLDETWRNKQEESNARAQKAGNKADVIEIPQPPPLTVDIIRAYLSKAEMDAAGAKGS